MPTPGPLELVIILVIALIILGPGKLPDVGASLGKSIREFRKASSDIQEAATVKVDTSPLPPAPAPTAPATTAVETGSSASRVEELERQLAEARRAQGTPVAAGSATLDPGSDSSS
jgi:sec-independent protein translocase protein TatA